MVRSRSRVALGVSTICAAGFVLVVIILFMLIVRSSPDIADKATMVKRLSAWALVSLLGIAAGIRQVLYFRK